MELVELGQGDAILRIPRDPAGVVLVDTEVGWHAASPGAEFEENGAGSLPALPGAVFWIADSDYEGARVLEKAQARRTVRIRCRTWLRTDIETMTFEWGLDRLEPGARAARLAAIVDRILALSLEGSRISSLSGTRSDSALKSLIEGSPSLATGLRHVMGPGLDAATPDQPEVTPLLEDALRAGAHALLRPEDGEIRLDCTFPRFGHALRSCAVRVPARGTWKKACLSGDMLTAEHMKRLNDLDLPVLVRARPVPRRSAAPGFIDAWTRSPHDWMRTCYTLEEVLILSEHFDFQGPTAVAGPGWTDTISGGFLKDLEVAAGTTDVAHAAWSAGIVAENILCGALRTIRRRDGSGESSICPEAVWVAMEDRRLMLPAIAALETCGGRVTSGYAGRITVIAPDEPEILSSLVHAAGDLGLVFPMATLRDMAARGVHAMPQASVPPGTSRGEALLLAAMRARSRNAMWRLDSLLDLPQSERRMAFHSLLDPKER